MIWKTICWARSASTRSLLAMRMPKYAQTKRLDWYPTKTMHRSAPLTRTSSRCKMPTLLATSQPKFEKTHCLPLCSNNPLPCRRSRRTLCASRSCRREQELLCTRKRTRRTRRRARSGIDKRRMKGGRSVVVLRTTTGREEERVTGVDLTPGLRPAVLHRTLAHLVAPDMTGITKRADTLAPLPTAEPVHILHLPVEGTRTDSITHVQGLVPLRPASESTTSVLAVHTPQMGIRPPIVPYHHIMDLCPLLLPEKQNVQLAWRPCRQTLKKCLRNGTSVWLSAKKRKGRFTRRRKRKEDGTRKMASKADHSLTASIRHLWLVNLAIE